MRKVIIFAFMLLLPVFLFSDESGALADSSTFTLVWNPEDSLTIGLTSEEPEGYGWAPSDSTRTSIKMGNVSRVVESIEVHNTDKLYAFCNTYFKQPEEENATGTRFNVNISGSPFSSGNEAPIPFTITWSDGSVTIDGNTSETIFFYSDSSGIYSQQRELSISATLPESAAGAVYKGTITLFLEVLS